MATFSVAGPEQLVAFLRDNLLVSEWLTITQDRVDAFAACTEDVQWVHIDPERAKVSSFGSTIVHGYLTLSLITRMWEHTIEISGFSETLNYGLDRVRFPAPLPVGARIRATFQCQGIRQVVGGLQVAVKATVEAESVEKPVCVADTLVRYCL